jgi:hypothetical protein
LTSQKPRNYILFGIIGISIVILIISTGELNSCGIQYVTLLNDIKTFEQNSDPEFCENTVNKILEFNEQCEPYIEILDCG